MLHSPTGGPAYPTLEARMDRNGLHYEGMSLRDYFAAQALGAIIQAMNINRAAMEAFDTACREHNVTQETGYSRMAYDTADAMIREGQKPCRPSQEPNT